MPKQDFNECYNGTNKEVGDPKTTMLSLLLISRSVFSKC